MVYKALSRMESVLNEVALCGDYVVEGVPSLRDFFVPRFCLPALPCRVFICRRFAAGVSCSSGFSGWAELEVRREEVRSEWPDEGDRSAWKASPNRTMVTACLKACPDTNRGVSAKLGRSSSQR